MYRGRSTLIPEPRGKPLASVMGHKVGHVRPEKGRSSDLTKWRFTLAQVTSNTSIKAALEPV